MNSHPAKLKSARFLDCGPARGAWNMAVDEVLLDNCRSHLASGGPPGEAPFSFRLYAWSPAALTLGRNQSARRDVFIERLPEEGIDLCRRLTGGRAVLHDREITYSIIGSEALLGDTIEESYRRISEGLAAGLGRLGVSVEFAPPSGGAYASQPSCFATTSVWELSIGGRKVVGSAQCREGGAILQHGSILLDSPEERLTSLLKARAFGDSRIRETGKARVAPPGLEGRADHAAGLCEVLGREVSYREAALALRGGMEETFGSFIEEPLTGGEAERAREAERRCYANPAWTMGRETGPPP
jgi:lipoate-protein ligase A